MATTNFIDKNTVIAAEWLNEVDNLVHDIFSNPSNSTEARTAINAASLASNTFTASQVIEAVTPSLNINGTTNTATIRINDVLGTNQANLIFQEGGASDFIISRQNGQTWIQKYQTDHASTAGRIEFTDAGVINVSVGEFQYAGNEVATVGANTFTGVQYFESSVPRVDWSETDTTADEQRWSIAANAGTLQFQTRQDDETFGETFLMVSRSGTTVGDVNFSTGTLKYSGIEVTASDGTTGGTGSAGAGNQYVELVIGGTTYKLLHDGTV